MMQLLLSYKLNIEYQKLLNGTKLIQQIKYLKLVKKAIHNQFYNLNEIFKTRSLSIITKIYPCIFRFTIHNLLSVCYCKEMLILNQQYTIILLNPNIPINLSQRLLDLFIFHSKLFIFKRNFLLQTQNNNSIFLTLILQKSIIVFYMNHSQVDLVKNLLLQGIIKSKQVAKVMQKVDRKYYAPKNPYLDSPQTLGYGATISAPHMHAYALQYLQKNLQKAKKVLDVGSGTGYLTVAMSLLAPIQCKVYGIQHVPELVQLSLKNIQNDHPQLLKQNKITIKQGDGRKGWVGEENIKFDVIHVGAAAQNIPEKLIEQLAEGGRMVLPVGGDFFQDFIAIDKQNGQIKKSVINSVRYVPLTDLKSQLHNF